MNQNPAIIALISAFQNSGNSDLLSSAFELALSDSDKRCVIDVATTLDDLDIRFREKMARASLEMGDMKVAIKLCGNIPELLALKVEAMIGSGLLLEAEAYYLNLVSTNPIFESTDVNSLIENAKAKIAPELASNVIGFSSVSRGKKTDQRTEHDENIAARLMFAESVASLRFNDVGGLEDIKKQITRRIVTPFRKPSLFAKYRRKAGGGVLLFGPPGCGKTLLARATAGECDARFVNVPVIDVVDKYIGEAERKLAAIFADARRDTPTVLFFDELEALAGSRGGNSHQSHISLVSTFLTEMDGFAHNNEGVLILAATNMPWGVDAAFRRPGRFDRIQFVPPPDKIAREEILRIQLAGRPVSDDVDLAHIAFATSGYSGADIENLVNTAVDLAIEDSLQSGVEHPVSQSHLLEAKSELRPTTLEWLTTARNYAKYSNSGGQYDDVASFLKANGL